MCRLTGKKRQQNPYPPRGLTAGTERRLARTAQKTEIQAKGQGNKEVRQHKEWLGWWGYTEGHRGRGDEQGYESCREHQGPGVGRDLS